MKLPQMTIWLWMVVVAVVAIMSWGIRSGGFGAMMWEAPILAASLAIWMVKKKQWFAAYILGWAVLVWFIIGLLLPPGTVSLGVGHTNVRLSFQVLDADMGQPVEGALIYLRDPDLANSPGLLPYNIDLETGPDGLASVSLGLQFVDSSDPATGRLLSFHVRYPQWETRVCHEGYPEFKTPFAVYERGNPRFHDGASPPPHNPPPIVIRLRRQRPASRARELCLPR
jgi:hypothetical protein